MFGRIKVVYRMAIVAFVISVVPLMGAGVLCLSQENEGPFSVRYWGLIIIAVALFWGIAATFLLDTLFRRYLSWLETSIKNIKANLDRPISQDPVEERIFQEAKSWAVDLCVITKLGHSILESIESGIITLDKDGAITFINSVGEELLGTEKKLAVGKSYRELQAGNLVLHNQQSLLSFLEDVIVRGICYDDIEVDSSFYGEKRTLNITTKILKDNTGLPMGVFLKIKDNTANRLLEEQMQRNECLSAVGQMAAGIAHEIRNPLQSIKCFVQLLQEKSRDIAVPMIAHSDIVIEEIERVNTIIKEFLQFSRPTQPSLAEHDLNHLVRDAVILMSSDAAYKNIKIVEEYGLKVPPLMLDESQIKQVLINLLSNALAAMPQGGTVTIRTCYDFYLNEARVDVSDTGIGIDEETLKQLGKPFFTTKDEGTGLGLAVSYRIMQNHGGDIRVTSAVGKGSTFSIILPGAAFKVGIGKKDF